MSRNPMNKLSRRGFLRGGGGAVLALPALKSLMSASIVPPQRMAIFYVPIGVVRRSFFPGEEEGMPEDFKGLNTPRAKTPEYPVGWQDLKLTATMKPLEAVKDKVTLITGLDRTFQNGTDVHAQCASCFLSSAAPYSVKSSAWPLDRTLDHVVADAIGRDTPFPTLEFSCNSHRDNKESIYFDNISWYGTGHVAPSIRDPRAAYQRMFGTRDVAAFRNVTDLVLADARSLNGELGRSDRDKFAEYFESVRAIETRMDKLEKLKAELGRAPLGEPADAHLPRGEYIRLMGDLMVAALQTGLTRVATMMIGPERWDTPYTYEGLFDKPMSHHQMSHNQRRFVEQLERVDEFHMRQFAYVVERMAAVREADGSTLLDNTILTYGSGLGDGGTHQYNKLPIIVAGSGGGKLRSGGRHLHCGKETPLANLWLTQARALGVKSERFADSTGPIGRLLA
jgi:hypothetical protein